MPVYTTPAQCVTANVFPNAGEPHGVIQKIGRVRNLQRIGSGVVSPLSHRGQCFGEHRAEAIVTVQLDPLLACLAVRINHRLPVPDKMGSAQDRPRWRLVILDWLRRRTVASRFVDRLRVDGRNGMVRDRGVPEKDQRAQSPRCRKPPLRSGRAAVASGCVARNPVEASIPLKSLSKSASQSCSVISRE